ncbi:hypothetical protein HYQ46_010399 [Verticillium longisporum]|nr:hypothetical protein HYQ46_010399 [Verticillium longisporum]
MNFEHQGTPVSSRRGTVLAHGKTQGQAARGIGVLPRARVGLGMGDDVQREARQGRKGGTVRSEKVPKYIM